MLAKQHPLIRRKIRIWISKFTLIIIVFTTCCYIYAAKIEPNWIEVVPIQLTIPNLSMVFEDFKIVQIGDIHASKFMPEKRLAKIIRLVNQQQPDVIAITGDLITHGYSFDANQLSQTLSQLQSKSGIFAVLGNHDHWEEMLAVLKQVLVESNITNLDNQVCLIERDDQQLAFAGLDDPYWGKPDLQKTITQLPNDTTALLLVHEPDYIETSAATHRFVLQLSGHSHGGQIRVPFLDPLILPPGGRKYFAGLNQVEDTIIYTNRGLGMTNLPFRFGSRPEITVFTLHSAS